MNLTELAVSYLKPHYIGMMLVIAMAVVGGSIAVIIAGAKKRSVRFTPETRAYFVHDEVMSVSERFYELLFSSTAILLFVSVYFLIDYFGVGMSMRGIWNEYNGLILLAFILGSVIFTSMIDNLIIPLTHVHPGERATMRLMGMVYMLIIFAYIKFIYKDNNYDSIIMYFLTLVIGRFVYFDASLQSFSDAMKETYENISLLVLTLICSGVMAFAGFRSGYLLPKNGVVMDLFVAHLFLLLAIFIFDRIGIVKRVGKKLPPK